MATIDKSHYKEGRKYEPWDVITDWGLDYLTGSAVKYLSRAGRKAGNSEAQDLQKAIDFLQKRLDNLGVGPNEIKNLRGTAKTREEAYETKMYREDYDPT